MSLDPGTPITGALVYLQVNGKVIGYATDFNASNQRQRQRVDVLGDPYSKKIPLVGITANASANTVVVNGEDLQSLGVTVGPDAYDQLTQKAYDILLLDEDDKVKGKLVGAALTADGFQVQARGLMMQNVSWEAIKLLYPSQL